jgi:hypothetical protein
MLINTLLLRNTTIISDKAVLINLIDLMGFPVILFTNDIFIGQRQQQMIRHDYSPSIYIWIYITRRDMYIYIYYYK